MSLPAVPTGMSVRVGNGQVTVSWPPPTSVITGYTIRYIPANLTGVTVIKAATDRSHTISGLTNGIVYSISMLATNSAGSSAYNASVSATPSATNVAPSAPTIDYALSRSIGTQIDLAWSPGNIGSAAVTSYTVKYTWSGNTTGIPIPNIPTLTRSISLLTPSTDYTFSVSTTTSAGTSLFSEPVTRSTATWTPTGAPPTINSCTATNVSGGYTTISVVWTAPEYTAWQISNPDTVNGLTFVTTPVTSLGNNMYSHTLTTANLGARVIKVEIRGVNTTSNRFGGSMWRQGTLALPPTGVSAIAGNGQATVSWTPPTDLGKLHSSATAATLSSYTITASPGGATTTITAAAAATSGNSTKVYGLSAGTAYTFTITTNTNVTGGGGTVASSLASSPGSCTITTAPPPFTSIMRGLGHAVLKWSGVTGVTDMSGTPTYIVRTYNATTNALFATDSASTTPAIFKSGLTIGSSFYFTAMASWTSTTGNTYTTVSSNSNTIQIPSTVPVTPTIATVTANGSDRTVTWTWTGLTETITGWEVSTNSNLTGFEPIALAVNGPYTYTYTSPLAANAGSVRVRAINGDIYGNDAARSGTLPIITSTTAGNGQVTVSWSAPSTGLYTTPLVNYTVTASPGGATATANNTTTTATVPGLTNGTAYTFTVRADGSGGTSVTSSPSAAVTPSTTPSAPTINSVTPGDSQLTVNWTAGFNGGSAVTSWQYSTDASNNVWTTIAGSDANTSSYTITSLANGTTYSVAVRAVNARGTGAAPASSTPGTPMGTLNISAIYVSSDYTSGYTLTFDLSGSSNLPANVESYTVKDVNDVSYSNITIPSTNRITIGGLADYTEYDFNITVTGYEGTAATDRVIRPRTLDRTNPAYPDVTVAVGDRQLTLTWPNIVDTGSPMANYYIFSSSTETNTANALYTLTASSTNTQVITDISNGTLYNYYVRAKDTADNLGAAATAIGTPSLPPSAPTINSIIAGNSGFTVNWTAGSNGGSIETAWQVSTNEGVSYTTVAGPSSATITSLTNGVEYTVVVRAVNAAGNGTSSTSRAITPVASTATYVSNIVSQVTSGAISNPDFKANLAALATQNGPSAIQAGSIDLSSLVTSTAPGVSLTNQPTTVLAVSSGNSLTVDANTDLSNNTLYIPTYVNLTIGSTPYVISFNDSTQIMNVNTTDYSVGDYVPLHRNYTFGGYASGVLVPTPLLGAYIADNGTRTNKRVALAVDNLAGDAPASIDVYNASTNALIATATITQAMRPSSENSVVYYRLDQDVATTVSSFYYKSGSYTSNTVSVSNGVDWGTIYPIIIQKPTITGTGPYTFTYPMTAQQVTDLDASVTGTLYAVVSAVTANNYVRTVPVSYSSAGFEISDMLATDNPYFFAFYDSANATSVYYQGFAPTDANVPAITSVTAASSSSLNVAYTYSQVYANETITVEAATDDNFGTIISSNSDVAGASGTIAISGLSAGTTYYVRAEGSNIYGDSSYSSSSSGTTSGGVAAGSGGSPPSSVTISSAVVSGTSVTVTFSGGTGATSFLVKVTDPADATSIQGSNTGGSPVTVSNLPVGTYKVYVVASNANGSVTSMYSSEINISSGGGGVVPCFFGNAPVLTAGGYRRMDSLRAGDKVMTPEGAEATVERVKDTQCTAGPFTNPYVIPKGRFGAERRVLISPNHKVVTEKGMVEAKDLGLEQEDREGTLTYYNLELTGQACMVVGGVAVESLAPIKRMVLTMDQFKAVIQQKYGGFNATVLANVQRTCRILADGRVEVPVLRK
jgi:hypothetical protein